MARPSGAAKTTARHSARRFDSGSYDALLRMTVADGAEMCVSRSFRVALERRLDSVSGAYYGSGMNATVESAKKAWTEAELEARPEDGYIHEVVDGELVMSPKNNWFHGRICTRLIFALEAFNRLHRLGV